jgi:hypothetical protein
MCFITCPSFLSCSIFNSLPTTMLASQVIHMPCLSFILPESEADCNSLFVNHTHASFVFDGYAFTCMGCQHRNSSVVLVLRYLPHCTMSTSTMCSLPASTSSFALCLLPSMWLMRQHLVTLPRCRTIHRGATCVVAMALPQSAPHGEASDLGSYWFCRCDTFPFLITLNAPGRTNTDFLFPFSACRCPSIAHTSTTRITYHPYSYRMPNNLC